MQISPYDFLTVRVVFSTGRFKFAGTGMKSSSITPAHKKTPRVPPFLLTRCSSSQGGSTKSFVGVTTRYCKRLVPDLETELLELQGTTKAALEASWEEARNIKARIDSQREIILTLEGRLTRLRRQQSQHNIGSNKAFVVWASSSVLPPRNQMPLRDSTLWRSVSCFAMNQRVPCSWYREKDQRQKEQSRSHWDSLLTSVLKKIDHKSSTYRVRDLNVKLRSLRLSHVELVSGLRKKLHQKDSAKAVFCRDVDDLNDCILRLQQDCVLLRMRMHQERHEGRKEREDLMIKIVAIFESVRRKDKCLQKCNSITWRLDK